MIMKPAVLAALMALASPMASANPPIDASKYHRMLDDDGKSGPCRGVNGSDKVNSRDKSSMTQEACESACTADNDKEKCAGYAFSATSEDGLCIIYGPGQDGSCPSHPERQLLDNCGDCSVSSKTAKNICGTCKIPDGQPKYSGAASYADNEGFCGIQGGIWTAGTWTAGTWVEPTGGWLGDSQVSTHINHVTSVGGYDCYDKDLSDHLPSCAGSTTDGGSCQSRFDDEVEGDETVADLTEGDCTAGGTSCVFSPAPEAPIKYVHSPIETTAGWNDINIPFGDALNKDVPIALGACRSEGTNIAPPSQKDCRWDLCRASTGESVGTQAGCRQACLDCPSGTCTAYSHKDDGYCVIHGPYAHLHPFHHNHNSKESWVDTWATRERDQKFCLENVPDNPPGCSKGDTAKPNPQYMCQTLKTSPERWEAYGGAGDSAEVMVHIDMIGDKALLTDSVKKDLKKRMADLVFWPESKTKLMVMGSSEGPVLHFELDVDTTVAEPMMNMLMSQFGFDTRTIDTLLVVPKKMNVSSFMIKSVSATADEAKEKATKTSPAAVAPKNLVSVATFASIIAALYGEL